MSDKKTASALDYLSSLLTREVDFMHEHSLNATQIYYLKLLFFQDYNSLYRFVERNELIPSDINILHEQGYLVRGWDRHEEHQDGNEIVARKMKELSMLFGVPLAQFEQKNKQQKFLDEQGIEFWQHYPATLDNLSLKVCNEFTYKGKTYSGKHDLIKLYCEIINYSEVLHKEIIDKLKYEKASGYKNCRMRITAFVTNEGWNEIQIIDWNEY